MKRTPASVLGLKQWVVVIVVVIIIIVVIIVVIIIIVVVVVIIIIIESSSSSLFVFTGGSRKLGSDPAGSKPLRNLAEN
nr:hypothetical protein BaRGS_008161 [Batillaria attramentaria]